MYLTYGDARVLQTALPAMEKLLAFWDRARNGSVGLYRNSVASQNPRLVDASILLIKLKTREFVCDGGDVSYLPASLHRFVNDHSRQIGRLGFRRTAKKVPIAIPCSPGDSCY